MSRDSLPFIICFLGLFLFSTFNIFGIKPELLQNHLISWSLAVIVFIIFSRIPIAVWRTNMMILYVLSIVALLVTLLFAPAVRGARRWFDILGFSFQLSEYAKPFVLMYLAHFMASRKKK
ncbi:MAG: Lipid II flippase FtsW [Microgenomates bacterium OLB22]|nr:MAG: Lipid II flippase FtsW [Microgenomates bacterium OLB22]